MQSYVSFSLIFFALHIVVVRTLTGHKSSVRSMDFHPYGSYVATGSLDTNIKVKEYVVMLLSDVFFLFTHYCFTVCMYGHCASEL